MHKHTYCIQQTVVTEPKTHRKKNVRYVYVDSEMQHQPAFSRFALLFEIWENGVAKLQ